MQMLFEASDEAPDSIGLGILAGRVRWLPERVKRPQLQWNRLDHRPDPMFDGLGERPWMYFVHSLAAVPTDPGIVAATCSYGGSVNVAFRSDNIFATQFHPEKSADAGLRLLGNFTVAAQRHAASSRAAR
jgi:glutamine amidotransferase